MKKREKVFNKTKGFCYYCGEKMELNDFHIEHLKPKSKGGTNDISNLVPSCCVCNLHKGELTIEEFRNKLATLHSKNSKIKLFVKYNKVKFEKIKFYFEKN